MIRFFFPVNLEANRGDSVHALKLLKYFRLKEVNYSAVFFNPKRGRIIKYVQFLVENIIGAFAPKSDLLYIRYFPFCSLGIIIGKFRNLPCIVELNAIISEELIDRGISNPLYQLVTLIDERVISRYASGAICVTEGIRNFYFGDRVSSAIVLGNGVDIDEFDSLYSVPNGDNFAEFDFGFVGSLSPWQDLETLIAALVILRDHYHVETRTLIVGQGANYAALVNLVSEHGLSNQVHFLGEVSKVDIPHVMRKFRTGVAPLKGSRLKKTGTSAVKILEYIAAGRRVICTRVTMADELTTLVDFFYEPESADDLAKQLYSAYLRRDHAVANKDISSFTWDAHVTKLISFINSKR